MGWPSAGGGDSTTRGGPNQWSVVTTGIGKIEEKWAKTEVLPQQNPTTPIAGERAHRHKKERGEERKGRRLTSDAGETFPTSNWTDTVTDLREDFPAITVVLPWNFSMRGREEGSPP